MSSFCARSLSLLGAVCLAGVACGQGNPWAMSQNAAPQSLPRVHVTTSNYAMGQLYDDPFPPSGDSAYGDECTDCGQLSCCGCSTWFAGVGGLVMTRDDGNDVWLSFDTANLGSGLLGTPGADMDWDGGVDVRIGRYFNGGCNALEVVYWGLYPDVSEANAYDPGAGNLNTTLAFQSLEYNGTAAVDLFDGAFRHRLQRSYQFHNVELNLLGNPSSYTGCHGCGRSMQFGWLAGVRYLKIDDGFSFASDDGDTVFNGAADELTYGVDVQNHLIGFQLGGQLNYYHLLPRLSIYGEANVGLYGNHITHRSIVSGSAGNAFVNDPASPNDGLDFDVRSSHDRVSILAELDAGLRYQISQRWSAKAGYRAVAVTGVGLSTNQIPMNFGDLAGVADIDSNGSMILHGGYAGVEFNY